MFAHDCLWSTRSKFIRWTGPRAPPRTLRGQKNCWHTTSGLHLYFVYLYYLSVFFICRKIRLILYGSITDGMYSIALTLHCVWHAVLLCVCSFPSIIPYSNIVSCTCTVSTHNRLWDIDTSSLTLDIQRTFCWWCARTSWMFKSTSSFFNWQYKNHMDVVNS